MGMKMRSLLIPRNGHLYTKISKYPKHFSGNCKSRPCNNSLADFSTFLHLKALKIMISTFFTLKKADGNAFRSAEFRYIIFTWSQLLVSMYVFIRQLTDGHGAGRFLYVTDIKRSTSFDIGK